MELPFAESFKIKMVENLHKSTREERLQWIKQAKYNLFNLHSDEVFIDLLTDSGTGAMSDRQWASMMVGDESYAGASSYFNMKQSIKNIFGFDYFLPTHQGRGAENVLFSSLVKAGDIIPGNAHFDTTKGHIEYRKAHAIDCLIDEAYDTSTYHPFKGNINLNKLEKLLKETAAEKIPLIILTITCNNCGGQPVSMENMREVSKLAKKYNILLCYDSARFAENAYFIKLREKGYQSKSIKQIVREMYQYADIATMSCKKDAIVNIGGFIGFKEESVYKSASMYNIMIEGYVTYGGMAGRDMNAIAQGLDESTEFDYLETRIKQVEYLGRRLTEFGVPVQIPYGGHAIFVDANKCLPHIPQEQYRAQTLAVELYIEAGIRGVEIGTILADRDPQTRRNRYSTLEFLRLAIPRRVYTNNHMDIVACAMKNVLSRRDLITTGLVITKEDIILRHFTVELERIPVERKINRTSLSKEI